MAIEYVVSAGEGTLIDYGVADSVELISTIGVRVVKTPVSKIERWPCDGLLDDPAVTLMAADCRHDCETGQ